MVQSLFNNDQFFANKPTAYPAECGTFETYCIVYGPNDELFFPEVYVIHDFLDQPTIYFEGTPTVRDPFVTDSPFQIRIKAEFNH